MTQIRAASAKRGKTRAGKSRFALNLLIGSELRWHEIFFCQLKTKITFNTQLRASLIQFYE